MKVAFKIAMVLFVLSSLPAIAQDEFKDCRAGPNGALACAAMVCRAGPTQGFIQCSSGLVCKGDSGQQTLVCNNGGTYSMQDGSALVLPTREVSAARRSSPSAPPDQQGSSCVRDASGLVRCSGGLVCRPVMSGGFRCNNGKTCSVDHGLIRCNDGSSAQSDAGGLTRHSDGSSSITDSSGLTRRSDGTACITDASGLTRCFPKR